MNALKRSHSLVRTVILYSAVLAIVGVVFAIVQYVDRGGGASEEPAGAGAGDTASAIAHANRGEKKTGGKIRDDLPAVTKGSKSSIRIYSPDSNVARMEILVREWYPAGQRSDEYEVVEPEIRLRTPGGQEIRVTAARGLMGMKKAQGGAYDPRRGMLTGNVVLEMDRLSGEERKALAPEQRDAKPPDERLVRVELDDIEFDLEAARIATDGPFRASAVEGEVSGIGLLVRYSEMHSRVEHLEITRGREIVLRQLGRSMRIALPGTAQLAAADEVVETPLPPSEEPSADRVPEPLDQPLADDAGIPILLPDAPKPPKPRPIETYEVTFDGGVEVEDRLAGEVIRKLASETLSFMFDFGADRRDAARVTAGGTVGEGERQSRTQPVEPQVEATVTVSWSGSLRVDFVGAGEPEATGDRLHVVATGSPVRVLDRQGQASCNELKYHAESERVWLRGRNGEDVIVSSAESGRMAGKEILFDRRAGSVQVTGPGTLSDTGSRALLIRGDEDTSGAPEREVEIRFRDSLAVALGNVVAETEDPITGKTTAVRREYLESAVFVGDSILSQMDDSISGERVELTFAPPRKGQTVADKMQRLFAEGSVVLTHGNERIACDRLDVEMDVNERGKVSPRRAEATGNVVASEGSRRIAARDRMIVDLRLYERPKPAFDLTKARAIAVRKGVDPATVDWEVKRREYEAKKRYAPGLRRLQAFGDVMVRDPGQNLNVSAGSLDCSFVLGRQIDKARVMGDGESAAHVELREYAIQGRLVDLDVGEQFAQVPGAGRLTFNSRKDLDGRELAEPRLISVTWMNRMTFHGRANKSVFDGAVHAASQGSTFDCARMTIDFEDVEPVEPAPEPETDWWIFTPLLQGPPREDDVIAPRLNKEPVFLAATGGVVVLSSNTDEGTGRMLSRVRIAAPAMDLDLKGKLAVIEHAGNLLIEDYKLPKDAAGGRDDQRTPFGGFAGQGPSQTYLTWQGSMAYSFKLREFHTAHFEKEVELIHRSGAKLLLRDQLSQAAKFEKGDEKEAQGGRDAALSCQSLFVTFRRGPEGAGDRESGLGNLSGFDLDKFQAEHEVFFEDSGVSVIAERVTYDREQALLTIFGDPSEPAQIHDQRDGYRNYVGPVIYWSRTNNRIEAPDLKVFSR